ncbi:MAG: tRNA uridine-5-carboxymethylaminomethyl(34) synthesis GTPase MnmE [bacterium]|nr:tRNA uridine-5-carboxymethylaminomethyl(34) synthesis GTPase MnmE [bacterium]
MNNYSDTIVAPATPPGEGGVGVVRISGPRAPELARRFFNVRGGREKDAGSGPAWKPRHLYRGEIRGAGGEILDDGLLLYMPAPYSYTGEDVIEIHGHGSPVMMAELVRNLVEAGARLADRGEFTLRAYLRGKLDLTQAEAVLDLVQAQTREGLSQAAGQLLGRLRDKIEAWREALIAGLARLEAEIDFPEDVPEDRAGRKGMKQALETMEREIAGMASHFREGKILREGLRVAIIGRPNVGKSSLFNALLKKERALVDPEPGTTRDVIEASAYIKGRKVVYYDTAGRRKTGGRVEQAGIRMSDHFLEEADLIVLVLDGAERLGPEDYQTAEWLKTQGENGLRSAGTQTQVFVVVNKMDLPEAVREEEARGLYPGAGFSRVSAREGTGLAGLEEKILALVASPQSGDEIWISNLRHYRGLIRAREALKRGILALAEDRPPEFIAEDLREAGGSLGEILGREFLGDREEVLSEIFSRFCLGK